MLKNTHKIRNLLVATHCLSISQSKTLLGKNCRALVCGVQSRSKKDNSNLSTLFTPVAVKPTPDDINVGAELTGAIAKPDLLKVLSKFYQLPEVKQLLAENGIDSEKFELK